MKIVDAKIKGLDPLEKQMQENLQALETIRAFYRDGTLSNDDLESLKRIQIPQEFH
jgi:hypothetical protein